MQIAQLQISRRLNDLIRNSSVRENLASLAFFSLLAVIALRPITGLAHYLSVVHGGDVFHNTWTWNRNLFNILSLHSPLSPNIMFPDPNSSFYSEAQLGDTFIYAIGYLFSKSDVVGYVFVYFCSIVLTAHFAYKISRFLGAAALPAVVAGIVAGFAPYHYLQITHVQILTLFWVLAPLYLILNYLTDGKRHWLYLLFALLIPVCAGPSYNMVTLGFFMAAITGALVFRATSDEELRNRMLFICGVFAAAMLINFPIWHHYFDLFRMGNFRDAANNDLYKVDLASLLMPSIFSSVYGNLLSPSARPSHGGVFFAGFAALGFIAMSFSVFKLTHREADLLPLKHLVLRAFQVLAIFLLIVSLGKVITWNGHYVMPNLMFKLVTRTMVLGATRYIAHFAYIAMCAAAIVSAFVLSQRWTGRRQVFIAAGLCLAMLIETDPGFAIVQSRSTPDAPAPAVYKFLATLPPRSGAMFLPFPEQISHSDRAFMEQFKYMHFAHLHQLWIANGTTGFFSASYIKALSAFSRFPSNSAYHWMIESGLRYVILDRRVHGFERIQEQAIGVDCAALKKIYDDRDYAVFQVEQRLLSGCGWRYKLGDLMSFKSGAENEFRVSGWSSPERWGTWSDGARATLKVNLDEKPTGALSLSLFAHIFGGPNSGRQQVGVIVNGHVIGTLDFDKPNVAEHKSITIPADAVAKSSTMTIEFVIGSPKSPKQLGISKDWRMLGIGMIEARISAVQ